MTERLQKILSAYGIDSRRAAEKLLLDGRVTVDGKIAALGDKADPEINDIRVDGSRLPERPGRIVLMLHKPRGYVTTLSDEHGRPNAAQLVSDCGQRVYPIGRLDMESEGLLLFTNDGALAERLTHPRGQVQKVYALKVRGVRPDSARLLARPIELDGRPIQPPEVTLLRQAGQVAWFRVTIREGRNRQIRRMCEAAGLTVLRLRREQEGNIALGALPPGAWRYLTEVELAKLADE